SLAFSPDASRLVSGLADSTLLVWDVAAAQKVGKLSGVVPLDLSQAWADLGAEARKAFAAQAAFAESPEKALALLKVRLNAAQRVRRLVGDVDSNRFAVREEAGKRLEEMGDLAQEALWEALARVPKPEARRRIEALLEKLSGPVTRPAVLRGLRAVAVLEGIA